MDWIKVPQVGCVVSSTHPRTCLNPDPTFEVSEIKYERGSFYVRGERTCWFHINMICPAEHSSCYLNENTLKQRSEKIKEFLYD